MAPRLSQDIFGNDLNPFASSAWTQPAAIFSPFLSEQQLQYANVIITALFAGVCLVLLRRACGTSPLLELLCCGRVSPTERCFDCSSRVFVYLRANLGSYWIYFLRFVAESLRSSGLVKKAESTLRVVVVGDGLALGFGDWVTLYSKQAGIVRRVEENLQRLCQEEILKCEWEIFNRGHFATTSEDWRPDCSHSPRFHSLILRANSRNLFDSVFGKGSDLADAQVVIVAVGTMDCRGPPDSPGRALEYTAGNIEALVGELVRRGKFVVVCQLNDARRQDEIDQQMGMVGVHHRKNTKIGNLTLKFPGKVFLGANFTHVDYRHHKLSDGCHLQSSGYTVAAKDLMPSLLQACKKAELEFLGVRASTSTKTSKMKSS